MHAVMIAVKDLKIIFRDRKALAILLLMPMLLTTVLGFSLSGVFDDNGVYMLDKIPIAVVFGKPSDVLSLQLLSEEQQRQITQSVEELDLEKIVIEEFLESAALKKIIDYRILDLDNAQQSLEKKEIDALIRLPDHFTADYILGKKTEIKISLHTDSELRKTILYTIFSGLSNSLSIPRIGLTVFMEESVRQGIGTPNALDLQEHIKPISQQTFNDVDFHLVTEKGRSLISSMEYYTIAMTVMFILFSAGYGLENMISERTHLTLSRTFVSGGSRLEILTGKFLFTLALSFTQVMILFLYTFFAFSIPWNKHWLSFAIIAFSVCFAVAGLSVLLCSLVKTEKGSTVFQSLVINSFSLLGGSFMPIYIMPKFLQEIGQLTPNGQALKAFIRVMEGSPFHETLSSIYMLLGFGVVCLMIGTAVFRPAEE